MHTVQCYCTTTEASAPLVLHVLISEMIRWLFTGCQLVVTRSTWLLQGCFALYIHGCNFYMGWNSHVYKQPAMGKLVFTCL